MIKRTANAPDTEPDQQTEFKIPSEKEHLFQVVDYFDNSYEGNKFNLDLDTVIAKLEVVGGEEEGLTMLNRCSLDDSWKGFFATRLFLKSIGEPYKGQGFEIDPDKWIGKQFYATVKHAESKGKTYANIGEYNFEKQVEQTKKKPEDVEWDKDL